MEKILMILKSRTVWMFIALVIINGIESVRDMLPGTWLPTVDALIGLAGVYFRVKPRQNL